MTHSLLYNFENMVIVYKMCQQSLLYQAIYSVAPSTQFQMSIGALWGKYDNMVGFKAGVVHLLSGIGILTTLNWATAGKYKNASVCHRNIIVSIVILVVILVFLCAGFTNTYISFLAMVFFIMAAICAIFNCIFLIVDDHIFVWKTGGIDGNEKSPVSHLTSVACYWDMYWHYTLQNDNKLLRYTNITDTRHDDRWRRNCYFQCIACLYYFLAHILFPAWLFVCVG